MTSTADLDTLTRIVATLGPASRSEEKLAELLEAGVSVCRLNFSHGALEEHAEVLARIRRWSDEHRRPVAVLGDLSGPKIRLREVAGGSVLLRAGDVVRFVRGDAPCTASELTTSYERFVDEVEPGHRIYIDDGLIRLLAVDRTADAVECTVTVGGPVSSHKGVNLPDTPLSVPALTEKDRRDLAWAIEHGLDYVALSFVRRPADLDALREILGGHENPPRVVAKIEKCEALEHIDAILERTDALMVARGDLGVEMDIWRVPVVQKMLIERCRQAGVPVIVATQMLQSMVANPTPTRAEVSDVATAIFDGADAVMLSAETASGQYPALAVEMMARVAREAERYQAALPRHPVTPPVSAAEQAVGAVCHAAVQAALDLKARVVAAWTATGRTVHLLSGHRLPMPVVGLTYDDRVYRRLCLLYGVVPLRVEPYDHPSKMAEALDRHLLSRRVVDPGDLVVVVTSTEPETPGATDTVLVHTVRRA